MPSRSWTIDPIGPQVLVQLLPEDAPSERLIVLQPDNLTQKATVMAFGDVPDLKVGDTVLCRPLTGITIGDQMLLPQSGILAVL